MTTEKDNIEDKPEPASIDPAVLVAQLIGQLDSLNERVERMNQLAVWEDLCVVALVLILLMDRKAR